MNPTENRIDLSLLDPILLKYNGRNQNGRSALLPLLHEAQTLYGWLPREVQETISRTLHIPLADIHGVIEFYTMFYNQPTAKRIVRICDGMACHLKGSAAVMDSVEETLGLQHGETSDDGMITYERVPCLGMCEHGPNALNGDETVGMLTPDTVDDFLEGVYPEPRSMVYGEPLLALGRIGMVNPYSLSDYEAQGGYHGLRKALSITPESLIDFYKGGEILGRGGAMFPFGLKIEFVRAAVPIKNISLSTPTKANPAPSKTAPSWKKTHSASSKPPPLLLTPLGSKTAGFWYAANIRAASSG